MMLESRTPITTQDLAGIVDTSSVRAAVLLRAGSKPLMAGNLTDVGFERIQTAIERYWLGENRSDLTRYAGLSLDGETCLLFAQPMPKTGTVVGLIFPLTVPLVRIRKEMTTIMRYLLDPDREPLVEQPEKKKDVVSSVAEKPVSDTPSTSTEDPLEQTLQSLFKSFPEPDPDQEEDSGWQPETDLFSDEEKEESVSDAPRFSIPEKEEAAPSPSVSQNTGSAPPAPPAEDDELFNEMPLGTDLLTSRPAPMPQPPDPVQDPPPPTGDDDIDDVPLTPLPLGEDFISSDETGPIRVTMPDEDENDWQPLNDLPVRDEDLASMLHDDFDLDDRLTDLSGLDDDVFEPETQPEPAPPEPKKEEKSDTLLAEILAGEMEDAQAMDEVTDVTFYLVPRLAHHYILGELSHRLRRWVPRICQAFGWRLDFLSVRPDYLKWTLSDFPGAGIKEMLEIMRRQTSDRIFRDFPSLQVENQTGDYWSPSYLVDRENRYFSTQALMSFVSKTRFEEDDR